MESAQQGSNLAHNGLHANSRQPDAVKLRGGYYTPPEVARWLCDWAIRRGSDRVLEPSSGDGAFLQAACRQLGRLGAAPRQALRQVTGVEIAAGEATKARRRLRELLGRTANGSVRRDDFFRWINKHRQARFDCVVGNPPFIRYQNFPEPSRSRAMQLLVERGLKANRLTNIWVPFVVAAAGALAAGGRMALVLPAELLQVGYAAQLRMFLAEHFAGIQMLACNHLFFERAEQEVLLLLADGFAPGGHRKPACRIQLRQLDGIQDLSRVRARRRIAADACRIDHRTEKWLKYFLDPREVGLLRSLRQAPQLASLGEFASVDVGIVTGRNAFFVLDRPTVEAWDLADQTIPLVGRSAQLAGATISKSAWSALAGQGERVFLLALGPEPLERLPASVRKYVAWGESQGTHLGYKCRIRRPWYRVPSVWMPDCFFFRQIYDFPRAVINRAAATSTDTIHRMRCHVSPRRLVPNLYTHLSAASAEVEGRSYGGGVLELEPNEAERLLIPQRLQSGLPPREIDALVRSGRLQDVLDQHDRLILRPLGLNARECRTLAGVWNKLRDRRLKRRRLRTG